jgi:hypothetical protein
VAYGLQEEEDEHDTPNGGTRTRLAPGNLRLEGSPSVNDPQIPTMPVAAKPPVSSNPRTVDGDCLRLTQRPPIHGVGEPLRGMDVLLVRLTVRHGRSPGQVRNGVRAVGGRTGRSDPRPHIYSPRSLGSQCCRQWFRLSQMIPGERFTMGLSGRWAKTHTKWANFLGPKSIGKGLGIFQRFFHEGRPDSPRPPLQTRRAAEGIPHGFGASRLLYQMAGGIGDDFQGPPLGQLANGVGPPYNIYSHPDLPPTSRVL